MAIYPGAVFKPTPFGGRTPRNRQGRGILHVAVSGARSLPPSNGKTWHMYVAEDGYCEQYVDSDFRAYASGDANDDAFQIETAGGLGSSAELNAEKWTPAQVERLADIMRWEAAQPDGAPLELLPDARPGRRGWGPHRLGIKHSGGPRPGWWQPGSELWSNSLGKECPGDAKVAQIPGVIERARTGSTDNEDRWLDMAEQTTAEERLWQGIVGRLDRDVIPVIDHTRRQLTGLGVAVTKLSEVIASGRDDLTAAELEEAVARGTALGIQEAGESLRAVQKQAEADSTITG